MDKPMTTVPKLEGGHASDNCMTPLYMAAAIVPHLKAAGVEMIWECAAGDGRMANYFETQGFRVRATDFKDGIDYLDPERYVSGSSIAHVTNVPFSKKIQFVREAYRRDAKWAFIMPITIEGELCRMFDEHGMQEITPYQRAHYKTPRQIASGLDYYWICANKKCHEENQVHFEVAEIPNNCCPNCNGMDFKKMKYTAQIKTCWFTHGLSLPKDRIYTDLEKFGYPNFV